MDTQLTEPMDEPLTETPEDVAILYSWANLHGAKYRDFSASRREYRAQVRHRAAEDLRSTELQAKDEAEAAAAEAERIAREAERAARAPESYDNSIDRERALHEAEEAARRAAAERVEAARRAEAAAIAEAQARREEREIAEAHASAQRQAARYAESEIRRRSAAGPQPRPAGLQSDPYEYTQGTPFEHEPYDRQTSSRSISYAQPPRVREDYASSRASGERRAFRPVEPEYRRRPQGYRPDEVSGMRPAYRQVGPSEPAPLRSRINSVTGEYARVTPVAYPERRSEQPRQPQRPDLYTSEVTRPYEREQPRQGERATDRQPDQQPRDDRGDSTPAWLYGNSGISPARQPASVDDTLQDSRERVASRWYALKGVFEPGQEPAAEAPPQRRQETRTPALAVFSLGGGVGKTSLVATLGRALSSLGEKVLLADTTSHGLLPYYFGASELRPGVVRTFSPPSGSTDAPIYLVSYDIDQAHQSDPNAFSQQLGAAASGTHRILLDLNASSGWVIRRLNGMSPTVLVPVAPDMNSVISLQGVEKYFAGAVDAEGRAIQPYYVLNQFDAALPLHLDVREVLRRQLGERLLPIVIRRSPAVSEALAEGMTVVDYAADAPVAEDYMNIANWLRGISAPTTQGFRNVRWSER